MTMSDTVVLRSVAAGVLAGLILLGLYFGIVSLVSGPGFAGSQFGAYWYFIVALAAGFGIQIGLYAYLRQSLRHGDASGRVAAVTGTTSTAAMVSCCTHYLVNILPILGATGIATLAAQYQVELFWVGIAMNLFGIYYIGRRVIALRTSRS